ncbi:GNAT family N-acetyltransferase [Mycobacterium sp.]|uniref:GNAT family N-acetyltransferase n=1 Tax=Mycobacterium sp. TaxID=1785 RepID=UPI003BAA7CFF
MKTSDITIREAQRVDFTSVAEMHYPVWRQSWTGILTTAVLDLLGPASRWAAEFYPQSLSRTGWAMWIAESDGKTLGMSIFGPEPAYDNRIHIDALYIAEESQRHGIGSRLLNAALLLNPEKDLILWCAEKNDKARRFYEQQNFHVDGRTFTWNPLPGVNVAHVGYRLYRPTCQS